MSNNGPRFQAREGAGTGHDCCFDAHVVDTVRPPSHEERAVCDCGSLADAIKVATALNRHVMQMAEDQGNGDGN